jgi:GrpB-like predicted nucleotidyltransferase (UPF0157 family)
MKVNISPYNSEWKDQFSSLKDELSNLLFKVSPKIEHIGSTSIEGLWAKPVIDILIGINENVLDDTISLLHSAPYIYIEAFTNDMPERRFFIRMKEGVNFPKVISDSSLIDEHINQNKISHIHIVGYKSPFWIRHIAFREYLKHHHDVKIAYQKLKQQLSQKEWSNAFEFNHAKSDFIQLHQAKALEWYQANNNESSF